MIELRQTLFPNMPKRLHCKRPNISSGSCAMDLKTKPKKWKAYPITPMGKPRMTQRDRWKKRPVVARYHAFKDQCRLHRVTFGEQLKVIFVIPMPKSWSKKKRQQHDGEPHQQKPDVDNLVKALMDAVHENDQHVYHVDAFKCWGEEGSIQIENSSESTTGSF